VSESSECEIPACCEERTSKYPKAFGIGLEALLMIELSKHKRSTVDRFMDDIAGAPQVRFAFLVTGRPDHPITGH